jgi:hypothetical protein
VVTVNRPLAELEGALPAPLTDLGDLGDLGDAVEVRLRPAPGGKGTELAARLTGAHDVPLHGQPPVEALRSALRQAKQVAEVGYVLEADLHTAAHPPPVDEPLRQATRHTQGRP